jgi:hypothetical protein
MKKLNVLYQENGKTVDQKIKYLYIHPKLLKPQREKSFEEVP